MFASPIAEARALSLDGLERELAEVTGILNVAHGRIVTLMADALDGDLWQGYGIHSPAQWLAWKTGLPLRRAQQFVKLAERRDELPCATAALVAGELSVDQAGEIARHVPPAFEAGVTDLAKLCTVEQLRRTLPHYRFQEDLAEARRRAKAEAGAGSDPEAGAPGETEEPAAPEPVVEERRELSMGCDEEGWWIKGRLPVDEGALVERALRSRREDLYREATADLAPSDPAPQVGLADALVSSAETVLRAGQAAHPGSDRYTIYAHLEVGPTGTDHLALHLGPVLPDHLRRLHTCDATLRPVLERDGVPTNVGRDERLVPRRVRRLVEHRHGGCAVPGCNRRLGLDIHHIVHWEDGGPTDTANLVSLCRKHHRTHHLGLLGIRGNADRRDGLTFTDRWGLPLDASGTPIRPPIGRPLREAAADAGVPPGDYRHPLGEKLQAGAVTFAPSPEFVRPGARSGGDGEVDEPEPAPANGDRPPPTPAAVDDAGPPPMTGAEVDPTRAGPTRAAA